MIFVLMEAENNLINPVIPKLTHKINKSCVKYIRDKVKLDQLSEFKKPPLFEQGWFLIYKGLDRNIIRFLGSLDNNVTVFQAFNKAKCEQLINILVECKLKYKIIDNLQISKDTKLDYIRRELHISGGDVDYLYNRTRGYLRDLTNAVYALKHLRLVTRDDIKALVPKTARFGLVDIYNYMIGLSECKMSYEDAIKIVYKYRYGIEFLREFLLSKLKSQMLVYELMSSGELSINNYRGFKHKSLTEITEYQLYKIIEQNREVSFEYLYFLEINLSKIPNNSVGVLQLVNILQLRKGTK